MASPALELCNVTVGFAGQPLLEGLNLAIAPQEKYVLIGPSGHGKSVILKLMAGLLKPDEGQIFVEGDNLWALTERERQKRILKMGMLFQKNALFDSLTAGENIAFPMREVLTDDEAWIQQQVSQFLDEVAISHAKDLLPDEISGGMQKRLGIARALALQPEIIFYDDPTAGLDPITSRLIMDLILRLQQEHKSTVVAITNDMNRAYQLADRIGMLIDGTLIETGSPETTQKHPDPRVKQFISGSLEGPLTQKRSS